MLCYCFAFHLYNTMPTRLHGKPTSCLREGNEAKNTMALLQNYSNSCDKHKCNTSSIKLLNHNTKKCDDSQQTNNYSVEVTYDNKFNSSTNQQQVNKEKPSDNSAKVKEICKIVFILVQIIIYSVFINMIARSSFGAPKNDEGNTTHTGTLSPKFEVKTVTSGDDNYTIAVTEKHEMSFKFQEIHVSSINEYKKKIETIPMSVPISLFISADKPSDLGLYGKLPRSIDISEVRIKGYIDPNHLYELLVQLRKVRNIVIIENKVLKYNNIKVLMKEGPKIILQSLKTIKFQNITSGNTIYSIFSKHFLMTGVNFLEFSQTEITEENISAMRKLLEHLKYSLRTLHFPNVHWNSVLFQNFLCVFPNLVELRLDFLSRIDKTNNLLGTVNRNAPNLKRFVSKHGYLRFSHLSSITSLKNVENLSFGLIVPSYLDYMDITFLTRNLPLLNFLELSLSFDDASNCRVLESDDLKRNLSINYFTECDLVVVNT